MPTNWILPPVSVEPQPAAEQSSHAFVAIHVEVVQHLDAVHVLTLVVVRLPLIAFPETFSDTFSKTFSETFLISPKNAFFRSIFAPRQILGHLWIKSKMMFMNSSLTSSKMQHSRLSTHLGAPQVPSSVCRTISMLTWK